MAAMLAGMMAMLLGSILSLKVCFFGNTLVIQVGVGLGSCAKGARLIIGRYSGGVVFDALTPTASSGQALALSPRERGQNGKAPVKGTGQKESPHKGGR